MNGSLMLVASIQKCPWCFWEWAMAAAGTGTGVLMFFYGALLSINVQANVGLLATGSGPLANALVMQLAIGG